VGKKIGKYPMVGGQGGYLLELAKRLHPPRKSSIKSMPRRANASKTGERGEKKRENYGAHKSIISSSALSNSSKMRLPRYWLTRTDRRSCALCTRKRSGVSGRPPHIYILLTRRKVPTIKGGRITIDQSNLSKPAVGKT